MREMFPPRFAAFLLLGALFMLAAAVLRYGPRWGGEPSDLERAAHVVRWITAPAQLSRSLYSAVYPEGRPSDLVAFLFSPAGTAEWPPEDGDTREFSEEERQALRATGVPFRPRGVRMVPHAVRPGGGKQLVVKFDDARRMIRVEGFPAAGGAPALTQEWELARVTPSPMAKALYEEHRALGVGPGKSR
jgi:hypothetical protein